MYKFNSYLKEEKVKEEKAIKILTRMGQLQLRIKGKKTDSRILIVNTTGGTRKYFVSICKKLKPEHYCLANFDPNIIGSKEKYTTKFCFFESLYSGVFFRTAIFFQTGLLSDTCVASQVLAEKIGFILVNGFSKSYISTFSYCKYLFALSPGPFLTQKLTQSFPDCQIIKFIYPENIRDKTKKLQNQYLHPNRVHILFLSTHSPWSTMFLYLDMLVNLCRKYPFSITLKPHPTTDIGCYNLIEKRVEKEAHIILVGRSEPESKKELYDRSEFIFSDAGGSMYSALYHGKKILLLDDPEFDYVNSPHLDDLRSHPEIARIKPDINLHDLNLLLTDSLYWEKQRSFCSKIRSAYFYSSDEADSDKLASELLKL